MAWYSADASVIGATTDSGAHSGGKPFTSLAKAWTATGRRQLRSSVSSGAMSSHSSRYTTRGCFSRSRRAIARADGEDLQRFADRAVHVVDHAEEDVLQAVRPAGERGGGLVQLAAQCGERAAGRGDGVRGRGGRAPPGGALRGAAHDSVAIASRP